LGASDTTSSFSRIDGVWTVTDGGANSLIMPFVQSDLSWALEGQPWTEARTRNKHQSTPVVRIVGDGNCTASATLGVNSFYGSTSVTPYEVLTLSGGAAGWATTAIGDKKCLRHTIVFTNPSGATQTVVFNYGIAMNIAIDPAGNDGLMSLSFDLTDLENKPDVS
jgi:hypothetical protein